jgi:transposase-like protein
MMGRTGAKKETRRVHAAETRAACMAALLAGQAVGDVAAAYRLPKSTVSRWRAEARLTAGRSDDVGALLVDYLRESLTSLRAQAMFFRDTTWLRQQSAAELGTLHGITVDKCVRLLTALENSPIDGGGAR